MVYDHQKDIFKQADILTSEKNSVNFMDMKLSEIELEPIHKIGPRLCFKRLKTDNSEILRFEVFSIPSFAYTPFSVEKIILLEEKKQKSLRSCTFEVVDGACNIIRLGVKRSMDMRMICDDWKIESLSDWNVKLSKQSKLVFHNSIFECKMGQDDKHRFDIQNLGNWDDSKWALKKR